MEIGGTSGTVLGWEETKRLGRFKYLGSVTQDQGRLHMEVNERGKQAGVFFKASMVFLKTTGQLDRWWEVGLYQILVLRFTTKSKKVVVIDIFFNLLLFFKQV